MAFFLLLILMAVALGIIGAVVHGLLYLLIVGIVIFLAAACRSSRGGSAPTPC